MSIGKVATSVIIKYPDGTEKNTTIAEYSGKFSLDKNGSIYITQSEIVKAIGRGECFVFNNPSGWDWETWELNFTGSYNGKDLPPFKIKRRMTNNGNQQDYAIERVVVDEKVLVLPKEYSGGLDNGNRTETWAFMYAKIDNKNQVILAYRYKIDNGGLYGFIADSRNCEYFNYVDVKEIGFPYGDGESTSQGGQGEMTDTTEPIEIDSKPLLTTGDFLRVYKLTATDLSALQAKLISNGFLDGLIPKLRTDAMDYIVGLNAIPINATNVASSTIKIANLDTEINASYLSWYIEDIDFGEIALSEYFQTFMDYSPYTKLSVYIPYCGIVPLNVDNFMNDKISMKCRVDMLTGQFVVFISNSVGVITTVSGNCAYQLPIRANDYNRLVTSGLGLLGGIVGTAGALATGNIPLAIGAGLGTVGGLFATSQSMTKPDVTSKGSLGGNYGLLGNRTPYLIIQRPTISVPSDYGKTIGYMSRITAKLGDLTGFTVVEEIHLEHISATDDEKKLIENALKSGVIL